MSSGIQPHAIPGAELDPDGVVCAADALSLDGGSVRDAGAQVVGAWRGLAAHYEAPEAGQLLAVMDPVEASARDFGDGVQQMARVLRAYAEEIRPIKAALDAVRVDAYAFRDKIAANPEWEYDQGLVDENTALVKRVNSAQVRLWEAERTCANGIRALYCAAPWHAATGEDDPLGYGVSDLPVDAPMAWGSSVERKDHCPKSAAVAVKRFTWDGVIVDGLWGTVVGLGALAGVKDWTWSVENFTESWTAMGGLIGYANGEWSSSSLGDSWLALGKGVIAYDTWDDDPARAAGGAVFNVATIVIPGGAAVSGTKAAATAASSTARAATLLSRGARVVDFLDPVALTVKAGQFALPKLDDLLTGMRGATEGLSDTLRAPEVPTGLDLPTSQLRDLTDVAPSVRDPDIDMPAVREPAEVPARAAQLVGSDGSPVHAAPGGGGSGGGGLGGHDPLGPPRTPEEPAGPAVEPSTGGGDDTGASPSHDASDSTHQPDPSDGAPVGADDGDLPAHADGDWQDAANAAPDEFAALAAEKIAMYERLAAREDFPDYVRTMFEGSKFNWENYGRYEYREVLIEVGDPPVRFRVDSYTPEEVVVSRKHSQLADLQPATAKAYIDEMVRKYNPDDPTVRVLGTEANVAQFGDRAGIIGNPLDGTMRLEVPVQVRDVPREILEYAELRDVEIRDVEGRVYGS